MLTSVKLAVIQHAAVLLAAFLIDMFSVRGALARRPVVETLLRGRFLTTLSCSNTTIGVQAVAKFGHTEAKVSTTGRKLRARTFSLRRCAPNKDLRLSAVFLWFSPYLSHVSFAARSFGGSAATMLVSCRVLPSGVPLPDHSLSLCSRRRMRTSNPRRCIYIHYLLP